MQRPLMPARAGWVQHRSPNRAAPIAFQLNQSPRAADRRYVVANSLLDFVMSLVRDPDAAAHYAANPAQAIADANLTDVTSVDVNHLIPVVAESLSTAVPSTGTDGLVDDPSGNVWAS